MHANQIQLDRYALSQFTFERSKDNISPLRQAFIEWAQGIKPTHFLTFNFHDDYSMIGAQSKMNEWNRQLHRRLFRAHPNQISDEKAIVMLGYPEYTQARRHIHYHVVARVNENYTRRFLENAEKRWKKIVKTGELHILDMRPTEADLEKTTIYMTKSSSFTEWYIPADYKGTALAAGEHAGRTKH